MKHSARPEAWRLVVGALVVLVLLAMPTPARAAPPLPATAGWPLPGVPRITQAFDPPLLRWGAGHRGVDLAARPGDRVLAAAPGTVSFAGSVAGKGVVTIDHGGGLSTTYEPVRARTHVGAVVAVGEVIGVVTTGSHCGGGCLHWGLRDGTTYLDPLALISDGQRRGPIRLVAAARRGLVEREAAARAAARAAAEAASAAVGIAALPVGRPGSHGFSLPVPGGISSPFGRRLSTPCCTSGSCTTGPTSVPPAAPRSRRRPTAGSPRRPPTPAMATGC